MKELNIEYSTFKTLRNTYGLGVYYCNAATGYIVVISATNFLYKCLVCSGDDITDFDSNVKPGATLAGSEDDATALATVPYKWSDSSCLVAQKGIYVDGNQIQITSGGNTGSCTWQYASNIELQGVDVVLNGDGAKFGDSATMTVEHPIYGEVYRFGNAVRVIGKNIYTVLPEVVAPLPAGLIVKAVYNAVDTNGREVAINLRCYK